MADDVDEQRADTDPDDGAGHAEKPLRTCSAELFTPMKVTNAAITAQ